MNYASILILRLSLGVMFVWIGVLILLDPMQWGELIQPWARDLLFLPLPTVMVFTGVFDIAVGAVLIFFIHPWAAWFAALLAALHVASVLVVTGITDTTVRDIGLLGATIVLTLDTLPHNSEDGATGERDSHPVNH